MDSESILQIKQSLVGAKPPIWRRVLIPATMRLGRLHHVLQAAMGWSDYHLHVFTADGVDYGEPDPELEHNDERRVAIGDLLKEPKDRLRYVYDFGDHWRHDVVLEKISTPDPEAKYPVCIAGARRCPPEDCGGVWGYADLLETLADPAHEEHTSMLEWLGLETASDFHPAHFDVARVNLVLGGRLGSAA